MEITIENLDEVKKILSELTLQERLNKISPVYSVVLSEFADDTRNSHDQVNYLEIFEKTLGIFKETSIGLRREMDIVALEHKINSIISNQKERDEKAEVERDYSEYGKDLDEAIFLSNKYALAFAGYVGLAMLESEMDDTKIKAFFENGASKKSEELICGLAGKFSADLEREAEAIKGKGEKPSDENIKMALQSTYTSWIRQFNWNTYDDIAKKFEIEDLKIEFENYSMTNGEFKQKFDNVVVDDKFMKFRKEDVIGGQEFGEILWNNMIKLSGYNHERQENMDDPAGVVFTFGNPGGGKTFNSHAYIQSFADLCRDKGIALWAFTHSTTDYASHYQNLTSNQLAILGGQIKDFPGIVIMYVADADNIFQSRKDPRLTAEQQQTTGVYFKMFDGTMIPKNGKFMAIMDANYVENIDDATKSRLFDEMVELKRFDQPDQFGELARRYLIKGVDEVGVGDSEWLEIGKYLLDSQLSNREIGHVVRQIRRDYKVPEEMVGASWDERVALRNEYLGSITKDKVIETFNDYINTRMEIEESSRKARQADDYERFVQALGQLAPGASK